MKTNITLNHDQQLFVIDSGNGYSCLGFKVCNDRIEKLCTELGVTPVNPTIGTLDQYQTYTDLVDIARRKNVETGWRSSSELNPKLIGLEGKRIECTYFGERKRFTVGKSMGFIPCHLILKTSNSHGGEAVLSNPKHLKNIRVIA